MAKARRRPLKVFQARFGFHDSVVASSSQTAALRAWGTRQNLFAEGLAHITDDPEAVKAALAHPDTPLRRPLGSDAPFQLDPEGLPKVAIPRRTRTSSPRPAKPAPAPAKPPPDRSGLDAAERALAALDADRNRAEVRFEARRQRLEAESEAARSAYVDARKAAANAVTRAREAWRAAGGED